MLRVRLTLFPTRTAAELHELAPQAPADLTKISLPVAAGLKLQSVSELHTAGCCSRRKAREPPCSISSSKTSCKTAVRSKL